MKVAAGWVCSAGLGFLTLVGLFLVKDGKKLCGSLGLGLRAALHCGVGLS